MSSPGPLLLLDTNILILFAGEAGNVPSRSVACGEHIVSVWEMLIKYQAGKLRLHSSLSEVLNDILYHSPWTILPIVSEHLPVLAALPTLHKDPFDRMIVAQAQHEGMTIVCACPLS